MTRTGPPLISTWPVTSIAQTGLAAEDSFKKAISLDPKSSTPAIALGNCYAGEHRLPEAEEQFQHATESDQKNPSPRGDLAWVYWADGKENDCSGSA